MLSHTNAEVSEYLAKKVCTGVTKLNLTGNIQQAFLPFYDQPQWKPKIANIFTFIHTLF